MHACLPAYLLVWTEADRIGPLLISYPASNQLTCSLRDNDGQTAVPMCPCPSPTPLSPPLTPSARIDPLSVRCSQDQQPRQYPFHHSGPQCPFHKLSQALGLKGCIAMGFGLYKHTNACGWQVGAQIAMPPPPSPPTNLLFAPSIPKTSCCWYIHSTVSTSISGGAKEQKAKWESSSSASSHTMHTN